MNESIPSLPETRVHEIDGLRGIAILSVLIFHYFVLDARSPQQLSQYGIRTVLSLFAHGVDLFFVISGFLIGGILLKVKSFSGIRTFYIRRILRIWPLYYLLLAFVYLALPDKSMFSDAPSWSFFLFIFNFWESFGKQVNQLLGPLWSIAIEEQFYLLGPIIFAILKRKQIVFFLSSYLFFSPILRLILIMNTGIHIDIWRFTPTRIDGIFIGLLLSIFFSSAKNIVLVSKRIKTISLLAIFLLTILVPSKIIFPGYIWNSFGYSLITFTFGLVLLVVQAHHFTGNRIRILNLGFLKYLGVRCYSIYLFHLFFLLTAKALYDHFFIDLFLEFALVLVFAHFSWKHIEKPFIRLGRKFSYESGWAK